jgi:hypothetical protein
VGEIVDRAQKEEKMEAALARLEDTWSRVAFQFQQHKGTRVSTIKMAEEDFEVTGLRCWLGCWQGTPRSLRGWPAGVPCLWRGARPLVLPLGEASAGDLRSSGSSCLLAVPRPLPPLPLATPHPKAHTPVPPPAPPQPPQALEDNQVLVQGMMANRYMATFRDAILGWNRKLMAVADVNQTMLEIQRTWAYLESLFIASEEVKKELPEAAARFANIDQDVKKVGGQRPGLACSLRLRTGLARRSYARKGSLLTCIDLCQDSWIKRP